MGLADRDAATPDAGSLRRAESDAFAARSHQRAEAPRSLLAAEITPVEVPQRRGDPLVVAVDEGVRSGVTAESSGRAAARLRRDGIITAASSSQISDGAAALVVASAETAARLGLPVLARIGAYGQVAGPDSSLQLQPANAIEAAASGRASPSPIST